MHKDEFTEVLKIFGIQSQKDLEETDIQRLRYEAESKDKHYAAVAILCLNIYYLLKFLKPAHQKARDGHAKTLLGGRQLEDVVLIPGLNIPGILDTLGEEIATLFSSDTVSFSVIKEKRSIKISSCTAVWHMRLVCKMAA